MGRIGITEGSNLTKRGDMAEVMAISKNTPPIKTGGGGPRIWDVVFVCTLVGCLCFFCLKENPKSSYIHIGGLLLCNERNY